MRTNNSDRSPDQPYSPWRDASTTAAYAHSSLPESLLLYAPDCIQTSARITPIRPMIGKRLDNAGELGLIGLMHAH